MQAAEAHHPNATEVPIHRDRNLISILIGIVGFFLIWGLALFQGSGGGGPTLFLRVPAAVCILFGPPALLTAVFGWTGVMDAFTCVFRRPRPNGLAAADAATLFQLWATFCLASGFLLTLVGLISMLWTADDPAAVGPGLAMALLGQLYGAFLAMICVALAGIIARRHLGRGLMRTITREAGSMAGMTVVVGTLTTLVLFGILLLSIGRGL